MTSDRRLDRHAASPLRVPQTLDGARQLVAAGRMADAFDLFAALAMRTGDTRAACAAFGWFLASHTPSRAHPAVDRALVSALTQGWVRAEQLAGPVSRYLLGKWPGAGGDVARLGPHASAMLCDPLMMALLRATPAAAPELDGLLARARYAVLAAWANAVALDPVVPFLVALAIRAAHSGHASVLPEGDPGAADEPALLDRLAATATSAADAALLACYRPPEANRVLPAELQRLAVDRARREAIAVALSPVTPLAESTVLVARQYEAHPYPAWVAEPRNPIDLPRRVAKSLGPAGRNAVRHALVAGCGTGQHAVTAWCRWPRAEIRAIDASRASLAYAIDRTADAPARLSFALGDVLHVAALGQKFDAIESIGVLHHLADPAAGLHALAGVLAPQGVMLIGLYATAARARLAAARALVPGGETADDDMIRAFRARALSRDDMPEITHSPDFYSIGGCRDLVFHVRERSYSLPEIEDLLATCRLELIALETPPWAAALLDDVPGETDLARWAAAEARHPMLFGAMYQLWLRHPRKAAI